MSIPLARIDERVSHLLGLRKRIEALIKQHNSETAAACSCTGCSCMEPAGAGDGGVRGYDPGVEESRQ